MERKKLFKELLSELIFSSIESNFVGDKSCIASYSFQLPNQANKCFVFGNILIGEDLGIIRMSQYIYKLEGLSNTFVRPMSITLVDDINLNDLIGKDDEGAFMKVLISKSYKIYSKVLKNNPEDMELVKARRYDYVPLSYIDYSLRSHRSDYYIVDMISREKSEFESYHSLLTEY